MSKKIILVILVLVLLSPILAISQSQYDFKYPGVINYSIINVSDASTLQGHPASYFATASSVYNINGSNIWLGNLSIGRVDSNPYATGILAKLFVAGDIGVDSGVRKIGSFNDAAGYRGYLVPYDANGFFDIYSDYVSGSDGGVRIFTGGLTAGNERVRVDNKGNVTIQNNVTASAYFGDGSHLTGVPIYNSSYLTNSANSSYVITNSEGVLLNLNLTGDYGDNLVANGNFTSSFSGTWTQYYSSTNWKINTSINDGVLQGNFISGNTNADLWQNINGIPCGAYFTVEFDKWGNSNNSFYFSYDSSAIESGGANNLTNGHYRKTFQKTFCSTSWTQIHFQWDLDSNTTHRIYVDNVSVKVIQPMGIANPIRMDAPAYFNCLAVGSALNQKQKCNYGGVNVQGQITADTLTATNLIQTHDFSASGSFAINELDSADGAQGVSGLIQSEGGTIFGVNHEEMPYAVFFNAISSSLYTVVIDSLDKNGDTAGTGAWGGCMGINSACEPDTDLTVGGKSWFGNEIRVTNILGTDAGITGFTTNAPDGVVGMQIDPTEGGAKLDWLVDDSKRMSLDRNGNLNLSGNATITNFYGGAFSASEAGMAGLTLNQSYQIINFTTATHLNGFAFLTNNKLELIDKAGAGTYQVLWRTEKDAGVNNHIYFGKIFINGIEQNNTMDRSVAQQSNAMRMAGEGFITLAVGDNVTLRLKDSSGTSTPTVFIKNINLVRVGV